MGRVLRLRFDIPAIALESWAPSETDSINLAFDEESLRGTISLNLPSDSIGKEWEFDERGQPLFERPIACSQLEVRIEADWGADWAENEARFKVAQRLTDRCVNTLLSYLAAKFGQYWVGSLPIREWSLRYFLKAGNALWVDESGESPVLGQKDALFAYPPFRDVWESSLALGSARWKELGYAIESEHEPELSRSLMASAKRYFENGEYRAAVVEAVTALEVALSPLIRQRCKEKGISHRKFKDVSRDFGVATYLKVLLPLVADDQELEAWRLTRRGRLADSLAPLPSAAQDFEGAASIEACIDLNKTRNTIVHEGWIPAQEKDFRDIRRGIRAADWLVDFAADAII